MRPVQSKKSSRDTAPVMRFRSMALGCFAVVALIALPLGIVWRQSYINASSMNLEVMTETINGLNRQIATLRLQCEQYSSTERIERIARVSRGLEYPSSHQIVLLSAGRAGAKQENGPLGIFAWFRRVTAGEKG